MSLALTYAPSSTLAPLHYLEIVSAVIMGFWVFGDIPNQLAFTGMIIVIASGLYIVFRERQIGASQ
jgi:drug/metabolite transporter (DMT)-like permease